MKHMPRHTLLVNSSYRLPHAIYNLDDIKTVEEVHKPTLGLSDRLAKGLVQTTRSTFD